MQTLGENRFVMVNSSPGADGIMNNLPRSCGRPCNNGEASNRREMVHTTPAMRSAISFIDKPLHTMQHKRAETFLLFFGCF